MAEIKKFPSARQRAERRRWQTSSGAPGRRPPRPPRGRKPRFTELVILIVLIVLAIATAMQSRANSQRPPREAMASYDFGTCKEARAAGAAPLMRGEPWYRPHLDEDRDGVACEVHPKAFLDDLFG